MNLKKIEASLIMDGLVYFTRKVNSIIGKNGDSLFGLKSVVLRNSGIYVNGTRGSSSCSLTNLDADGKNSYWPIGDRIINSLKPNQNVKRHYMIGFNIF
jgi:hypothetical protein